MAFKAILAAALLVSPAWAANATTTSERAVFTVPADADNGENLQPWIYDPEAKDPQALCPGYKATLVTGGKHGDSAGSAVGTSFTAHLDLAGKACNVYGNDVEHLTLTVEYQAADRLHVGIVPRYLGAENATWFTLPEELVPKPSGSATLTSSATAATYTAAKKSAKESAKERRRFSSKPGGHSSAQSDLVFSWSNSPSFGFTVTRKSSGDVLFSTAGKKLVYEDQFIEFVSPLPENYNLYGLGEVIHGFRLGNNLTRTIFAADVGDNIDSNIYGSHPFYLDTRYFDKATGQYVANATEPSRGRSTSSKPVGSYKSATHGVFLRNAHPQEVLLRPAGITWRTLGGSIDLYFYSGPNAADVMQSYQQTTIGLPAMQQYFTFGFHQCRWGYQNWTVLQEVVDNFKAANIPLETIWTDIDYMNQYRDFENDMNTFNYDEGAKFLSKLHANGQHYVPIVDSAIYSPNPENASDAYPPYERGVAVDAFVLNPDGSLYVGEVWPGYTVFPDWVGAVLNGTGAFKWWSNELVEWYKNVAFDGIWIDMSEVSSFCVGSCGSKNLSLNPVHPGFQLPGEPGSLVTLYPEGFNSTNKTEAASASSVSAAQATTTTSSSSAAGTSTSTSTVYLRTEPTPGSRNVNHPPYVINNIQGDLAVHALSPNATHHGGFLEYDTHNLNGHQILNATYNALLAVFPEKRPFIIGRSTFAGSGKWAGHWGGDNSSLWAYMVFSISQALSFSIFGVPMFGVDTCGFNGNTDMELCARWMQLSAFFPFYRNHNVLAAIPQEPYVWESVAEASRTAMTIRYSLLPYLYTLFAEAHSTGTTVMRALSWEFPSEPWLASADHQFMLGPALLVTPCLEQGASTVDGVFPGAESSTLWYDWYNQTAVDSSWLAAGKNVTIDAPLGHIPVFVRGGYVLPLQEPGMTTKESRQNPWNVLVALDHSGAAAGELYLDDGESLAPATSTWVDLAATPGSLVATPKGNFSAEAAPALANVTVLGVAQKPSSVSFNGTALNSSDWTYGAERLHVTGLDAKTSSGAWESKWTVSWK